MKSLLLILFLFTTPIYSYASSSNTYYISPYGDEYSNCESGIRYPWRSLQTLKNSCLAPGDTITFFPGTYYSEDLLNGNIGLNPIPDATLPIYIKAQPSLASPWPVKFIGDGFNITTGGPIEISGIEFIKPSNSTNARRAIISIGISNVSLKNNFIHGENKQLDIIISDPRKRMYDCIFAPANSNEVTDIEIIDNIISDCSQDAIDLPGTKNVNISHNDISNSLQMQVKGGAENVIISDNQIHSMVYGIVGGTMQCPFYCGSPIIPTLPATERYNAKNVRIDDNYFYDIKNNWIVNFTGWKDVHIVNNVIRQKPSTNRQEIFSSKAWKTQYLDNIATAYCNANPSDCQPCTVKPKSTSQNCVSVYLPPKHIVIQNNLIELNQQFLVKLFDGNHHEANNICIDTTNSTNTEIKMAMQYYKIDHSIGEDLINLITNQCLY